VRLLLDEHLSPKGIGGRLQARGHDVRALAGDEGTTGLADVDVLALAAGEARILVTCNARDFDPLAREWAESGRAHAGLVLIWTLDNHQHTAIVAALERLFDLYPSQRAWRDLVVAI